MKNKIVITLTVIVLLFILLNPTYTNFKEFTGLMGKDAEDLHKKANFLVCSVYQDDNSHKKYFGILKNFIDITPKGIVLKYASKDSSTDITDSAIIIKPKFDSTKPYDMIDGADTIHISEDTASRSAFRNLQAIYTAVSREYNLGSFPNFVNKIKDPKKRRTFYNTVSLKYKLGSYEHFENKIKMFYFNQY